MTHAELLSAMCESLRKQAIDLIASAVEEERERCAALVLGEAEREGYQADEPRANVTPEARRLGRLYESIREGGRR